MAAIKIIWAKDEASLKAFADTNGHTIVRDSEQEFTDIRLFYDDSDDEVLSFLKRNKDIPDGESFWIALAR